MMEQIPQIVDVSWHKFLQPLFNDPKMKLIKYDLLNKCRFYPAPQDIFRVFQTPLDKIKVVILGQDPYSNGEATGLAFSVKETTRIPPSLEIIRNEIINSGVERDTHINIDSPKWKELTHWKQQGVFLLNTALTVEVKNPNSHTLQWNWFSKRILDIISIHSPIKPVWLFWGSKAKSMRGYLNAYYGWNGKFMGNEYNYTLEADHPAAETYPNSKYKFSGCNHFKICNEILKYKKQTVINW